MFQDSKLLRFIMALLFFASFAFLGNYFSLPLFFGVDFIFGSIFVMLSIVFLGFVPSIFVVTVGAIYTLLLWGHPYAMIVFIFEAIFVGFTYKRYSNNLVLIDFSYWLLLGSPLALYFYSQQLGMQFDTATFIALKQSLNGIFNASIAGLIILLLQTKWFGDFSSLKEKISVSSLHFYTFLTAIILIEGTPIIYDARNQKSEQEQSLYKLLQENANSYFSDMKYFSNLDNASYLNQKHFNNLSFKLEDKNTNKIYTVGEIKSDTNSGEILSSETKGLNIWLPANNLPTMKRWKSGIYFAKFSSNINNKQYLITLEYPVNIFVKQLEQNRLKPFMWLNIMFLLGIMFSFLISKLMSRSIHEIASNSKEISHSMFNNDNIKFNSYLIREYDDLAVSLHDMTKELVNGIDKLNTLNDTLEDKVTEQTRILRTEKERYKALMQHASDGIIIMGLDCKVIEFSDIACQILGYTHNEMKNLYKYDWAIDFTRDELDEFFTTILYEPVKFSSTHKKKDGSTYDASVIAVRIKLGDTEYIYSSVRDVSEEKRNARDLQIAKEKAELANESKSRFLANMSHEIRTPMNGILGFIDRFLKTESNPEKIKQLETMHNSGETLLKIINDILDFSKIESGKIDIENSPVLLNDLVNEAIEISKQLASSNNLSFVNSVNANIPNCILGDKTRLKQVIFNLISNAIKFTEQGEIGIEVSFNETISLLRIAISDTGIGIDKQNQDKIFDAFSQEDISTTRKFGGTGLGLTISSRFIKLMNGELKFESELGKGSKFYFEIPVEVCTQTLQEDTKEISDEEEISFQGHALVVEDNKTNQMLMGMILSDFDVSYDIANDGVEGVQKHQENKYDIILMDENMPNMNGIEATKIIRNKEAGSEHIPIVAVTANALEGDRKIFLEAGMDDYVSKPYTEDDILEVLEKYLQKKTK